MCEACDASYGESDMGTGRASPFVDNVYVTFYRFTL